MARPLGTRVNNGRARPVRVLGPGLCLAATGAAIGALAHARFASVSPHIVAVLFGAVVANIGLAVPATQPGLRVAGRRVLRVGIALLGFRLSLGEVVDLGPRALAAVCIVVALTFTGTRALGRRLGLSSPLSLLVAVGYSICGASAIAAAEPFSDATEEEVAYSIALVTLCGSLAIVALPVLGHVLGMDSHVFGAWIGASVHDVGQVVAAASTRDDVALKSAVVVKLTRVALLAPLLLAVAVTSRRRTETVADQPARPPILPLFVVLFLLAAAVRSAGILSTDVLARIGDAESFAVSMGLAGLGAGVRIERLRRVGGRPLVLGLVSWVLVAAVSYVAVQVAIA
ncbi:MAG: YeiH family protein [Ilumatobacteraceae bacterium]